VTAKWSRTFLALFEDALRTLKRTIFEDALRGRPESTLVEDAP
jgi:hypothetical protein